MPLATSSEQNIVVLRRVLITWSVLTLFTLGVMLTHQSDHPRFFGRYSTMVFLTIVGLSGFSLIGLVASVALKRFATAEFVFRTLSAWKKNRFFCFSVLGTSALLIVGIWFLVLGDHLIAYAILRIYLVVSVLLAAYLLVDAPCCGDPPVIASRRAWALLGLGAVGLSIFLSVKAIAYFPPVTYTDEGWTLNISWTFWNVKVLGAHMLRYTNVYPNSALFRGMFIPLALWCNLFGFTLETARAFMLLVGVSSLPFLWGATRLWFDYYAAWGAVFLAATTVPFFVYVRADLAVSLFLSAALFSYALATQRQQTWANFFVGLCALLAIEGHPNAYRFSAAFGLLYLWEIARYRSRNETSKDWFPLGLFALGLLVGSLMYLVIHRSSASTSSQNYLFEMIAYNLNGVKSGAYFCWVWDLIRQSILAGHEPFAQVFIWGFGIFTLAYLWKRKPSGLTHPVFVLGVFSTLIFYLTYHHPRIVIPFQMRYHPSHWIPFLAILGGAAITYGFNTFFAREQASSVPSWGTAFLCAVFLVANIAYRIHQAPSGPADMLTAAEAFAPLIPREASVVGQAQYYLGMTEHENFIATFSDQEAGLTTYEERTAFWKNVAPDAFIITRGSIGWWIDDRVKTDFVLNEGYTLVRCHPLRSAIQAELWMKEVPPDVEIDTSECVPIEP